MATGVSLARIGAAALSLASTGALMILAKAAHPPAGATTLIVSLGIVTRPFHLLVIEIAVAILTLQAIAINRLTTRYGRCAIVRNLLRRLPAPRSTRHRPRRPLRPVKARGRARDDGLTLSLGCDNHCASILVHTGSEDT